MYERPVSCQDAHTRVGHDVQSEHVESLEEGQRSVQADLFPALTQHHVHTLQHDACALIRRACRRQTSLDTKTNSLLFSSSSAIPESDRWSAHGREGELTCVQPKQGFVQVGVEFQRVDIEHVACRRQRAVRIKWKSLSRVTVMDKKSETTPTLTGEDVEGCEDAVERLSVGQILYMQEDKGLEKQEWLEAWKHQEPHI